MLSPTYDGSKRHEPIFDMPLADEPAAAALAIRRKQAAMAIGDVILALTPDLRAAKREKPEPRPPARRPAGDDPVFDIPLADRRAITEARDARAAQMALAGKRKPAKVETRRKADAALVADAPAFVIERHGGGEVIDPQALDPLVKRTSDTRAIRLLSAWRPETLLKRGRITRRQYDAAVALLERWEAGGFDTIRGAQFGERIPSGQAPSSDVPHAQAMHRRSYSDALAALPLACAPIVVGVVIEGRTIELAVGDGAAWMPANKRTREAATHALLCVGLDVLADTFGL